MSEISIQVEIAAPPKVVWAAIADVRTHTDWMADAQAIRLTSEKTEGVGTTFECDTQVGFLRTKDQMMVTEWGPGPLMGVRHEGLVLGEGRFTLTGNGSDSTLFAWTEHLVFPWWLGGPVIGLLSRPLLRGLWRRNLGRLKHMVESSSS